jgi:NADPH:quinone reductase-like Zn-dependent oxidoreductase
VDRHRPGQVVPAAGELTWPEAWPAIPCHDLSGVVAAAGPGVSCWRHGDEVFGLIGFDRPGAAAEYATVPAADLAAKPRTADHIAAAAIPLGALTAWQALHEHADLRPGQHVLVHGGGGGSAPTQSSSPPRTARE